LGSYGKRETLWWQAIHLDKIQVRPDLEGHAVKNRDNTLELNNYKLNVTGESQSYVTIV